MLFHVVYSVLPSGSVWPTVHPPSPRPPTVGRQTSSLAKKPRVGFPLISEWQLAGVYLMLWNTTRQHAGANRLQSADFQVQ